MSIAPVLPWIDRPPPEGLTIWHYTDPVSASHILRSGVIWARPRFQTNDVSEADNYGPQLVAQMVEIGLGRLREPDTTYYAYARERDFHLRARETARRELIEKLRQPYERWGRSPYIACFSSQRDLLSLWSRYGNVALGFDAHSLHRIASQSMGSRVWDGKRYPFGGEDVYLLPCRYDNGPALSSEVMQMFGDISGYIAEAPRIAARFKHPGFREEAEWRLLILDGAPRDEVSAAFIGSRIELPWRIDEQNSLREIVLGPSYPFLWPNEERRWRALSRQHGPVVEVRRSTIPLRTAR